MKQINQALQQKLAEFKAKSGMNQTQLARGIGTSPASISMYLNGTYAEKGGNYETIEPKIEAFLEMQDSKAQREELVLGFVSTKATGWKLRGEDGFKPDNAGQHSRLAYAQAGGIVFEPFFISNDTDLALFKATKWGICRAIADAIAVELGAAKV